MAYDNLLYITGTASAQGATYATNSLATAAGITALGTNRVYHADLRVTGTIDGTTGTATIAFCQSTAATTGYETIAAFPAISTVHTGGTSGTRSGPVSITFRVTKPFVRLAVTLSSTAAISGVEVKLRPTGEPAIP